MPAGKEPNIRPKTIVVGVLLCGALAGDALRYADAGGPSHFRPGSGSGSGGANSTADAGGWRAGSALYSAAPRAEVCTNDVSPWLRLLPGCEIQGGSRLLMI